MVKKFLFLLVLVVAGAAIWFFFLRSNDKERVLAALQEAAAAASKDRNETTSAMLLKTQTVGSCFADSCSFQLDEQMFAGDYTPEDIGANLVRMRQVFTESRLSYYDQEVLFPRENEAVINFTGNLKGTLRSNDQVNEAREIQAKLRKIDGKWKFYSFKVREIIKK